MKISGVKQETEFELTITIMPLFPALEAHHSRSNGRTGSSTLGRTS